MCHAVPYNQYTRLMKKSLVEREVDLLNIFHKKLYLILRAHSQQWKEGKNGLIKKRLDFGLYAFVYVVTDNTKKKECPGD